VAGWGVWPSAVAPACRRCRERPHRQAHLAAPRAAPRRQVFLDVVESVNLLVSSTGQVRPRGPGRAATPSVAAPGVVSVPACRLVPPQRYPQPTSTPPHPPPPQTPRSRSSAARSWGPLKCAPSSAACPSASSGSTTRCGRVACRSGQPWSRSGELARPAGPRPQRASPLPHPVQPGLGRRRPCPCTPSQVLFEAQGRTNRQKAVEMEDIRFHQCVRLVRPRAPPRRPLPACLRTPACCLPTCAAPARAPLLARRWPSWANHPAPLQATPASSLPPLNPNPQGAVRERPHHLLHPARRRVRPHVLPPQPERQAAGVGGVPR
jgi:hypothetical protein